VSPTAFCESPTATSLLPLPPQLLAAEPSTRLNPRSRRSQRVLFSDCPRSDTGESTVSLLPSPTEPRSAPALRALLTSRTKRRKPRVTATPTVSLHLASCPTVPTSPSAVHLARAPHPRNRRFDYCALCFGVSLRLTYRHRPLREAQPRATGRTEHSNPSFRPE
jgi:hypothetical protein